MPKAALPLNIEGEEYKGFTVSASTLMSRDTAAHHNTHYSDLCVSGSQFTSLALETLTHQSLDIPSILSRVYSL